MLALNFCLHADPKCGDSSLGDLIAVVLAVSALAVTGWTWVRNRRR
jgi:hypothetical protein